MQRHPQSEFSTNARTRLEYLCEQRDWKQAQLLDTIAAYEDILERYPQSKYSEQAQARLKVLKEEREHWERLEKNGSLEGLKDFVVRHPRSLYAEEAQALIIAYEGDLAGLTVLEALRQNKIAVQVKSKARQYQ